MVDISKTLKQGTVKDASLATQQLISIKQATLVPILSAKSETIQIVVEKHRSIFGRRETTIGTEFYPKTSQLTILSTITRAQMTRDASIGNHVQERSSTENLTSRSYNHGPHVRILFLNLSSIIALLRRPRIVRPSQNK